MIKPNFEYDGSMNLRYLQVMGSTWFVLRLSNQYLNHNDDRYKQFTTLQPRESYFRRCKNYFKLYLQYILKSNDKLLGSNCLKIPGLEIKKIAIELLKNHF